jgi:ABC-type transport system substrate-binding protein
MTRNRTAWIATVTVVLCVAIAATFLGRSTDPGVPTAGRAQPPSATAPIVLRLPSFAINLNPTKMADVESRQVATLLHVGLVAQSQDGTVHPMLASAWRHNANTWEFDMKAGVTFSNGQPVRAADVIRSLCKAMQPSAALSWALASIARQTAADGSVTCSGLAAVGDDKVRITETRPLMSLLDALGSPAGWVLPGAEVAEGQFGVLPGAGPYVVKEIVPDRHILLEPRRTGSAVPPGATPVRFDYLPNDDQAAQQFLGGQLHVLDLTSPTLVKLLQADAAAGTMRAPGTLKQVEWDRYRVAIVNLRALRAKGFSEAQAQAFVKALSAAVDRSGLERLAGGVAKASTAPYPPTPEIGNAVAASSEFPAAQLTILTEPDAFSDAIAALLPRQVHGVTTSYRGTDKGVLLGSLFKGEFEIISMLLEAPVNSPEFWQALFTPGNPYSAVGVPIPGMEKLDPSSPEGAKNVGQLVAEKGNWVMLLKERRLQATAPGVKGILFSPSGQTILALISR